MNQAKILLNMNEYIAIKKIKKSAITKRTGINKDKLSRILNQKQEGSLSDLNNIAYALGQEITSFVQSFEVKSKKINLNGIPKPSYYMGEVTEKRKSDSELYSQLAERIHYIKTIATVKPTILSDF
jgi:transcriptional regulator with XRE-family HTH domain